VTRPLQNLNTTAFEYFTPPTLKNQNKQGKKWQTNILAIEKKTGSSLFFVFGWTSQFYCSFSPFWSFERYGY
jgi:hypothetical protein